MSILLLAAAVTSQGGPPPFTLTNHTVFHDAANGTIGKAGASIEEDGTVDGLEGFVATQIESATDWIIPNSRAADFLSDLEVKWDHVSGSTSHTEFEFADEGVYVALSEDRSYRIRNDVDDTDITEVIDITMRYLDTEIVAVGRYTLRVKHS